MKNLVLIISFTLGVNLASSQDWKMVYHHDKDGNAVEGSLSELIQAVYDGQEVRMAWWSAKNDQGVSRVYHLADAAFLTIMSDSIVMAQIRPIYGQTPDFSAYNITLKENLEWVAIGGTNGKSDAMMRNMVTGEIVGHNARQTARKWYVKK